MGIGQSRRRELGGVGREAECVDERLLNHTATSLLGSLAQDEGGGGSPVWKRGTKRRL